MGTATVNAPTVVCLHGLGRSVRDWDGVEAGLARYGTVNTVELPRGGLGALMAATADLPDPAILIGHSMAGVLALRRAAVAPERVAGVLLTDSFFPPSRNGRNIGATARDYGAHRIAIARDMAARRSSLRPGGGAARGLGSLARLGLRPGTFHGMARAVQAPVLVVHARDDHHVPLDFALAAAAQHRAWGVRIIEGGGHNVHVERPDDWLAATEGWLDGLATEPSVA